MRKQHLAFAGMWIVAIAAMAFLYLREESGRAPRRTRSADEALVIDVESEHPETSALEPTAAQAPIPEGPPLTYRGDRRHTGQSPYEGPARPGVFWQLDTHHPVVSQPVVDRDGNAYVGSRDHVFYSISRTGGVRWHRDLGGDIYSTAALDEHGHVFVGSDADFFFCLDVTSGEVLWDIHTDFDVDTGITIGPDGTIYFGSDDRRVYAVDRNGHVLWRAEVGGYVRAPMALGRRSDLIVPIFGPHARVASLDRATGEERWSFAAAASQATDSGVGSGPVVDRAGTIYFGADDDFVYAVDPDGGLRWVFQAGANVDGDPILTPDGALLIGSDDGNVYALRADAIPAQPRTRDAGAH